MLPKKASPQWAVLYCRYSPRPNDDDAIQKQAADLQEWCERHQMRVRMICFDPDVSGTVPLFSRPGLSIALSQVRRGEAFVVRNLDRACRSLGLGIALEEQLDALGAILVSVEQGGVQERKSQDWNAWAMRQIVNLMSEGARHVTNDRTSRVMLNRQRNGEPMSKQPPFGFDVLDGRLVQNGREQLTIRLIMDLHEEGCTSGAITRQLRTHEIPCRGKVWHRETVRRIIKAQLSHAYA